MKAKDILSILSSQSFEQISKAQWPLKLGWRIRTSLSRLTLKFEQDKTPDLCSEFTMAERGGKASGVNVHDRLRDLEKSAYHDLDIKSREPPLVTQFTSALKLP